ncbi:MAG: hypothetical protein MI861_02095 [Pirellulales bacterium]|nr:hypothetical protein [Pirellulales bacterium]
MKPTIAQWLASLILDEWPLPAWVLQRIRSHPDVAAVLRDAQQLASRLRADAGNPWPQPERDENFRWHPIPSRRGKIIAVAGATAAVALVTLGIWHWTRQEPNPQQNRVPVVESIDTQPILASLSAGQKVARNVSLGVRRLGTELVQAGGRIGAQFSINRDDQTNRLPEANEQEAGQTK